MAEEDERQSPMELEEYEDENDNEIDNDFDCGITFPLPPHEDESLGRDEFLMRLFGDIDAEENALNRQRLSEGTLQQRRTGTITGLGNAEAMALIRMIRNIGKTHETSEIAEFKDTLSPEEKQIIYDKFLVQFQKDAVEYLSVRLKKILEIFVNIWPGEISKVPYNLFHWSVEHFVARSRINQLYLDVLTIERTKKELNCAKFCIDVQEIIRLLDAIRSDVRNNADLCKNSIALIKEANYDTNADWLLDLDKNRELRSRLALQVFAHHSNTEKLFRESVVVTENKRHDAYMPIELRYRINWIRATGEQHLLWEQSKEKALQDELDVVTKQRNEDLLAHEFRDFVCQFEVDKYRVSIAHWEEKLEVDMEAMELKNNVTRHRYTKVVEDLQFYKEQVEMFKERISQVLREDEDSKILHLSHRSTKASFGFLKKGDRKKSIVKLNKGSKKKK